MATPFWELVLQFWLMSQVFDGYDKYAVSMRLLSRYKILLAQ
ncbi:hypothetical protein Pse7429DRAFT_4525 [Pseudanabaena biceps PCC 7429]|uniref:Uncharacterized protein n=1 Tax=Pseudanabaena biceps PCC 7429 TaxID=927668 RepID=L8MSD1_9CYAN|nr:hypothetical protein Pse7429DRAFT_4525 [Pseudanabaena biceps PCC 7429]